MTARVLPQGEIKVEALQSLIVSEIPEGQAIEYKSTINISDDKAKKNLCAEVASFANASGGDIVFGIAEKGGKATALEPLPDFDGDKVELQLRQIFNTHIEPAVPGLRFCPVEIASGESALVLQIPQSWSRPHALLAEIPQFPVRDGNRKRPLKLRELRDLFGASASIAQRMKQFRAERIASLVAGDAPARLARHTLFVLHVMPQSAFDAPQSIDLRYAMRNDILIWPMHATGLSKKINFDGVLSYFPGSGGRTEPVRSYVQVFRDGCIEALTTEIFHTSDGQKLFYHDYEGQVEEALHSHLILLQGLGVEPPIFVSLALIGAEDYSFALFDRFNIARPSTPIGRDVLIVPEAPVYAYADTYHDVLQEPFNRIWQTCGQLGSINYKDGQWAGEISRSHVARVS
jgi:hypothetical protein